MSPASRIAIGMTALLAGSVAAAAERPPFAAWINGTDAAEAQTQVQQIDADTFVIRQSVRTNFEAPFLYLLFGAKRALLIDSGAGGLAIRPAIDAVIAQWLARNGRTSIPLVVAHSHSHGDHVQGDSEFAARPDTRVVGLEPADVAGFFGVKRWPQTTARFDLGGRALTIIPTPGHEPAHIMVHDPRTRLLFSGDMLYAGRLYVPVDQFATFAASADRLAAFVRTHKVTHALGAHIEMTTTPGQDYAPNAAVHPNEHALELPADAIGRLQAAAQRLLRSGARDNAGDFILYPVPARPQQ